MDYCLPVVWLSRPQTEALIVWCVVLRCGVACNDVGNRTVFVPESMNVVSPGQPGEFLTESWISVISDRQTDSTVSSSSVAFDSRCFPALWQRAFR